MVRTMAAVTMRAAVARSATVPGEVRRTWREGGGVGEEARGEGCK